MIWVSLAIGALALSIIVRVVFLLTTRPSPESEPAMPEDNNHDVPPVGLSDLLSSLQESTDGKISDVMELNRDIVLSTRKMAHNILKLRQAHIEEAERLYSIAADLIDSAVVTATIAADLIDVEFGGDLFDPKQFLSQLDDDEDEDDE